MPRYNTSFELDVNDIDLIESALITHQSELSVRRMQLVADAEADAGEIAQLDETMNSLNDLLGRLHNQKVWYRPQDAEGVPYVGG